MGSDGIAYLRTLLVLLGKLGTENCVREFRLILAYLADIVKQSGAAGNLRVQPELGGHYGAYVCDFAGVLEKVLAVRRTVFHPTDETNKLKIESVDAHIDAGSLSCFQDFLLKLLAHLIDNLFDAGRMDTSVHHELMEGKTGNFPANRVEGGKKDGIRSVIDNNLDTRCSLKSPDISTLATDDTAFYLITLDREGSNCIFNSRFRCRTLDGIYNNAFSLFCGVEAGFIHSIVDIGLGLAACLSLHILDKHLLGLRSCQACYVLEVLIYLGYKTVIILHLGVKLVFLGIELALLGIQVVLSATEFAGLFLELVFTGLDVALSFAKLIVACVDIFVILALELEILLLCLKYLLLLDVLGLKFCFLDDSLDSALQNGLSNQYINCNRTCGASNSS